MIVYTPFWETLKKKGLTSYALIKYHKVSSAVLSRFRNDVPMSTHTLDTFCELLNCNLDEIAKYVPDDEYEKKPKNTSHSTSDNE